MARFHWCKLGVGVIYFAVACVMVFVFYCAPSVVRNILSAHSGITEGSLTAYLYKSIPFKFQQNIYVFNITNVDEFFLGARPKLDQLGPYVFSLDVEKDMTWSKNNDDLLTYRENRKFRFLPELSAGHLEDMVYTVDPVYAVAQEVMSELPEWVKTVLRPVMSSKKIIFKHSVGELLYDGYPDPLADLAHLFKPNLPVIGGRVGYLRPLNNTNDGDITVFAGSTPSTKDQRNVVVKWNGLRTLPYYERECSKLWGTNYELLHMFDKATMPAKVGLLFPTVCRPWFLHNNGTRFEGRLRLVRFGSGADLFSPSKEAGPRECHQPYGWPHGLFDVSACWQDFPALVSLPHFFRAEHLLNDVDGLKPDPAKHDFTMDIYPPLGLPVRPSPRLQINVRIRRYFDVTRTDDEPLVCPVMWQEIVFSESDIASMTSTIYYLIELPPNVVRIFSFLICAICIVIIPVYISRFAGFNLKGGKEDRLPILPYSEDLSDQESTGLQAQRIQC